MAQPIIPIKSSTQVFTEIEDINWDIVLFVDGSAAMVVTTSAVNFGLLSENEQDAIIYAYAGLLNSLSFPIQVVVHTQHKDISAYLKLLEDQQKKQKNPKLAASITHYREFVEATVKERDVLDKRFYIVIPFSALELGASPAVLFGSRKRGLPYEKSYIYERALTVLVPRRDHIIRLLARVGLRATQLTNEQLISLYYSVYNPGSSPPDVEEFGGERSHAPAPPGGEKQP
jgi:hypothetical protein